MFTRPIKTCLTLMAAFATCIASPQTSRADIDFESAIFQNTTITQNDAAGYAITADILEDGSVVAQLSASVEYGGGTNPFNTGDSWRAASGIYQIYAESTGVVPGDDTADGNWDISVTPNAGWKVDGISVFTNGTTIGNPDITNVTTDGIGSVFNSNGLITNRTDGDVIPNGGDLLFSGGSHPSGIPTADHSRLWAINAADATQLSFTYSVGHDETVRVIAIDAIQMDVALSQIVAVPEPSTAVVSFLAMSALFLRRKRS